MYYEVENVTFFHFIILPVAHKNYLFRDVDIHENFHSSFQYGHAQNATKTCRIK